MARGVCCAWETAVAAGTPACPPCPAAHRGSISNRLAERWKDRPRSRTPAQRRRAPEAAAPLPRAPPAPWRLRARTTLTPGLMPSGALSSRLSEQLCTTWPCSCSELSLRRPSQVALEVKNPPGNAGDPHSIPGSRSSPGGGHATRSSILVENPTDRGVGGRPSMGSQRGGHA